MANNIIVNKMQNTEYGRMDRYFKLSGSKKAASTLLPIDGAIIDISRLVPTNPFISMLGCPPSTL